MQCEAPKCDNRVKANTWSLVQFLGAPCPVWISKCVSFVPACRPPMIKIVIRKKYQLCRGLLRPFPPVGDVIFLRNECSPWGSERRCLIVTEKRWRRHVRIVIQSVKLVHETQLQIADGYAAGILSIGAPFGFRHAQTIMPETPRPGSRMIHTQRSGRPTLLYGENVDWIY